MTQPASISELRCADTDRELVAGVLNQAYADGRLSLEEHDERISKAYVARTFGELDALTTDLIPAAQPLSPPRAEWSPAPAPRVSAAPANPAAFRGGTAVMSTMRPGGPLHVSTSTDLNVFLGEARIDLVGATFESQAVTIALTVGLGEVRIRVPAGVSVVSDLANVMADFKCSGTVPAAGGVTVRLVGRVFMGEVKVLGPDTKPARFERFVR